jgi:ABC-2 type transport system permease protein
MNKKVFAVIKREFVTRVRTKGFIIGTLLFPFIIVLLFGSVFLFSILFQPSTKSYNIVDQTDRIFDEFVRIQSDTLSNGKPKYLFNKKDVSAENLEEKLDEFQKEVINKEIDGYIVIPENVIDSMIVKYAGRNVSNFEEQSSFGRTLSWIVTNIRLENKGFAAGEIRSEMSKRVRLVSRQVTEEGEIRKSGGASFGLTYFLTYVMMLMMMIYGQILMRSVIEEKSQRISETIISSIKPIELMVGKIIGICALGLTQLVIMGIFIYAALANSDSIFGNFGVNIPDIVEAIRDLQFTPTVFISLLISFFLGFIFYSALFAGVGAIVNTEDEGQHFQIPITFLIIIAFFIMISVAQNPETTMAFWISLVPLFTPIVMFARIIVSDPVLPDGAIISIFTMTISTVLLVILISKIYRVGILMYGKKPSIKEVIKWIRYS